MIINYEKGRVVTGQEVKKLQGGREGKEGQLGLRRGEGGWLSIIKASYLGLRLQIPLFDRLQNIGLIELT